MKTCSCCKTEKPLSEFYERKRCAFGVDSQCKRCVNTKSNDRAKERRATDPEFRARMYAHHKKYVATEKGRNAKLAGQRRYLASEHGRSVQRAANRHYKKSDSSHDARRYAAMKMATPRWYDASLLQPIYTAAFAMKADGLDVVVDHIVPLQSRRVCGLHVHWNMRIIDRKANSAKGNRCWPEDVGQVP